MDLLVQITYRIWEGLVWGKQGPDESVEARQWPLYRGLTKLINNTPIPESERGRNQRKKIKGSITTRMMEFTTISGS